MPSAIAMALSMGRFSLKWVIKPILGPIGTAWMAVDMALYMKDNASRVKRLRLHSFFPHLAANPNVSINAAFDRPALNLESLSINKDSGNITFQYEGVTYEAGIYPEENHRDRLVVADTVKKMLMAPEDLPRELSLLLAETAKHSLLRYY